MRNQQPIGWRRIAQRCQASEFTSISDGGWEVGEAAASSPSICRRFAAIEAVQRGYGGIVYIAGVLGCSTKTIERGIKELDQLQDDPAAGRVRRPVVTPRASEFPWHGGCFEPPTDRTAISGNNANSLQLFSAAGMDFVYLHLECNAPDDVLSWADDVLKRHADRRALITTHMGLGVVVQRF